MAEDEEPVTDLLFQRFNDQLPYCRIVQEVGGGNWIAAVFRWCEERSQYERAEILASHQDRFEAIQSGRPSAANRGLRFVED